MYRDSELKDVKQPGFKGTKTDSLVMDIRKLYKIYTIPYSKSIWSMLANFGTQYNVELSPGWCR